MSTMTEEAAEAAIGAAAFALRLPTVRTEAGHLADDAARVGWSHRAYLAAVLCAEVDERDARRRDRRVGEAHFPRIKRLCDFDLSAIPSINPATFAAVCSLAWVDAGQPLVALGDPGTGKTHILIGVGLAAAEAGKRVRYITCAALVNELAEAADERALSRAVGRYGRLDLLCLDELCYVRLDPRGAELLFQVLTDARNGPRSPSPPTPRSLSGARPSPIPAWWGRWWTGSLSTPTSWKRGPCRIGCAPPKRPRAPRARRQPSDGRPRLCARRPARRRRRRPRTL